MQTQSKLDVQDRICSHIPECPDAWQEITIHHVVTRTSGIVDLTSLPDYKTFKASPTIPRQTIARFKDKLLDFQPDKRCNYSNSGYVLLDYLIEQVARQSYEMFLQQAVFDPLQMKSTGYTGFGSHWEKPTDLDMTLPDAAGGLYSTVEDLYRWDQALYAEQILTTASLDLMFTPYVKIRFPGLSYDYGWFIGPMNNHLAVSHGGGIDGSPRCAIADTRS